MPRRRLVSGLCLLIGMTLAGTARFHGARVRTASPDGVARLQQRLPHLPVVDYAGRPVDLALAARGRKSVIVFFSDSCHSCQEVLPELLPFPRSLRLIMVNEAPGKAQFHPHTAGLEEALQLRDPNRVLVRSFPMSGMPTILFVDEGGVLREALVGTRARGRLRQKLTEFVGGED